MPLPVNDRESVEIFTQRIFGLAAKLHTPHHLTLLQGIRKYVYSIVGSRIEGHLLQGAKLALTSVIAAYSTPLSSKRNI